MASLNTPWGIQLLNIGIDLGGTKIEVIALDSLGATLWRHRAPTPKNQYHAILNTITELVFEAERRTNQTGTIGIGTPGTLHTATGKITNANSTCLNGQPLKTDIESCLNRPIILANDADCFALSEATDGAGKEASVVFGAILGTGVGAGIVVDGRLLKGPNGIAGEWGHNPLPWPLEHELPGPPCYCGRQGCIETFVSGTGLADDYKQATNETLTAEEIIASSDNAALGCVQRYTNRLARALASVINILDPDVIILGGGMGNVDTLYKELPKLWLPFVFSDMVRTRLEPPLFGDSSGVRGAAWLGSSENFTL